MRMFFMTAVISLLTSCGYDQPSESHSNLNSTSYNSVETWGTVSGVLLRTLENMQYEGISNVRTTREQGGSRITLRSRFGYTVSCLRTDVVAGSIGFICSLHGTNHSSAYQGFVLETELSDNFSNNLMKAMRASQAQQEGRWLILRQRIPGAHGEIRCAETSFNRICQIK